MLWFFFYYKLSTEIKKVTHKYFPIEVSKQLNYFIPVPLVPLTIVSHIRRAFLPVPFFDWNLPIPAVVCHDIRFCFTRNSHLHQEKLCPTKSKFWKDVPVGQMKSKDINRLLFTSACYIPIICEVNVIQRNTCCSCFGVDIFPNVSFMSKPHFIFANVKFRSDVAEREKNLQPAPSAGKRETITRFLGSHGNFHF